VTRPKRILLVEDDPAIATGLALNLKIAGYVAAVAVDGEAALAAIPTHKPDLLLLDINLPKKDGIALMAELRRAGDTTPIIVLSARNDEYDKVAALRLGADDYVTKPFSLAELMARVDAVLRRIPTTAAATTAAVPGSPMNFGDIAIDRAMRSVALDGHDIKLTRLEFELLCFLAEHPAQVFSRQELLRRVWGQRRGSPRTVDNFVAQLRSKLETDPENPRHLITVRGSGYRLDP
jgi:two-component system, OmpR family, alkaline phosphatase synthesis response regulator PhoP